MKYKVELLFSGNENGLNGAANFVRMLDDRDFWKREGIDFNVVDNSSFYSDEEKYRKSVLFKTKSIIKRILNSSKAGKNRFLRYEFEVLGTRVVDKIVPSKDTCYVLNDYMVANEFFRRFGKEYRTIFIMHNTGDMLSQVDSVVLADKKMGKFLRNAEKRILDCSDNLVFISSIGLDNFLERHENYKKKSTIISIGLKDHSNVIHNNNSSIQLVSVGTLHKRKNQIAIIKAVEKIANNNIELTLVGGGPKLKEWSKYCIDHNLERRIHLVGAKTDVFQYLDSADVFIMSSFEEGLPVAAQEAMQMGLPLILTDVGGCKELIDGNGILVKNITEDEIANAIQLVCNDKLEITRMGNRSREIYEERYTVEIMLRSYLQLTHKLMEETKK